MEQQQASNAAGISAIRQSGSTFFFFTKSMKFRGFDAERKQNLSEISNNFQEFKFKTINLTKI